MGGLRLERVRNKVLRGVDLCVEQGQMLVLVGPSGAGKTSLLKVIAGLMPHKGRVWFGSRDVTALSPHRRRVGMLFQELALFPHLSVMGNVIMGLRGGGVPRGKRRSLAMELLEMVGIAPLAMRSPAELSGGERQRVALARALACQPRILLLDEPFSSLDGETAGRLRALVMRLHRQLGMTSVVVTHRVDHAVAMAEQVGVVRSGTVVELGPPQRVLGGYVPS